MSTFSLTEQVFCASSTRMGITMFSIHAHTDVTEYMLFSGCSAITYLQQCYDGMMKFGMTNPNPNPYLCSTSENILYLKNLTFCTYVFDLMHHKDVEHQAELPL